MVDDSYDESTYKYRIFSKKAKERAVRKLGQNPSLHDFHKVSKQVNTTVKNLKRWFLYGTERKKGCGRKKISSEGEQQLLDWIFQTVRITKKRVPRLQMQKKALEYICKDGFIASKGFLDKFVKKNNIKQRINEILLQLKREVVTKNTQNDMDAQTVELDVKIEEKLEEQSDIELSSLPFYLRRK